VEDFFTKVGSATLTEWANAPSIVSEVQAFLKAKGSIKKALKKASPLLQALESELEEFSRDYQSRVSQIVDKGEPRFATNILFHVMCQDPRTPLAKLMFHILRLPKDIDCPIPWLDRLIKWGLRHRAEYISLMLLSGGNIPGYRGSAGFTRSSKLLQELVEGKPFSIELMAKIASEVESFHNNKTIRVQSALSAYADCLLLLKIARSLMAAFGIIDSDVRVVAEPGQGILSGP